MRDGQGDVVGVGIAGQGLERAVAQGAAAGIQLAHAGRKASTPVPFRPNPTEAEKEATAYEDWQPIAPSPVIHSEKMAGFKQPREMTLADIESFKQSFVDAVHRSEKAGFDVIEIHAAHGYLLNQFLSPLANKRTDDYGGSRDNRMRLLLELTEAVRAAWPAGKPLFVRISGSDNHPDGWTVEDSVVLSTKLKALGVDAVHVSSGGFDGAAGFRGAHLRHGAENFARGRVIDLDGLTIVRIDPSAIDKGLLAEQLGIFELHVGFP